jgi:hypothetical protein
MKLLHEHTSPDSAYLVEDYPYGFRLRCKIRYWLEYSAKHGWRFVSQTTNPKAGDRWNKPRASTYVKFGAAMYLDDAGHVQWSGLSEYSSAEEATRWLEVYGAGVPASGQALARKFVAAKVAYSANRTDGDALSVGLAQARKAWEETR